MKIFNFGSKKANERVISLHEMTPLRFTQYQQWHEVLLAGPTHSVVGIQGNDFPGLYYYNPTTQEEHIVMACGPINWNKSELVRRLHEKNGKTYLEIALISENQLSDDVQLEHWREKRHIAPEIKKDFRDAMPSQWEALETLILKSFELSSLPKPGKAHDWERTALQCLGALQEIKGSVQGVPSGMYVFFKTFKSGRGTYGPVQIPETEFEGTAELICQVGLCSALLSYAASNPKDADSFRRLGLELARILPHFYDEKTQFFQNTYPPHGEEWRRRVVDTWYAFHNLYHILRVIQLNQFPKLKSIASTAIQRSIRFVKACNYHIPLFAKMGKSKDNFSDDGQVIGFAMNPSVLGMHARCLVLAAKIFESQSDEYRTEAAHALNVLHRFPIQQMHHQTVQLSWAAAAAHALGMSDMRDDYTRCLLLQCYRWGENAGLFQGCAGIGYPAFRETVEAIEPWTEWLDEAPRELYLKQTQRLVLSKAKEFLVKKGKLQGLPNEGLATQEQPQGKDVGIAIYAAPQVFELARIQCDLKNQ